MRRKKVGDLDITILMNVDCETEKKDLDDAKLKHDESKKKYNE